MLAILADEYNVDLTGVEVMMSTGNKTRMNGVAALGIYRNYPTSHLNDF